MAGLGGCIDGAVKESILNHPDFQQEYPADPKNPSDFNQMKTVILSAWFTLATHQDVDAQFQQSYPYRRWMTKKMLEYARENMLLRDYGCRFEFYTRTKPEYVGGAAINVEVMGVIKPMAFGAPDQPRTLPSEKINLGKINPSEAAAAAAAAAP